jgi:hypothetical protein
VISASLGPRRSSQDTSRLGTSGRRRPNPPRPLQSRVEDPTIRFLCWAGGGEPATTFTRSIRPRGARGSRSVGSATSMASRAQTGRKPHRCDSCRCPMLRYLRSERSCGPSWRVRGFGGGAVGSGLARRRHRPGLPWAVWIRTHLSGQSRSTRTSLMRSSSLQHASSRRCLDCGCHPRAQTTSFL